MNHKADKKSTDLMRSVQTTRIQWICRFDTVIAANPVKPGVWRRKEGGFVIRARITDPRTGKRREIRRILPTATAIDAHAALQEEIRSAQSGATEQPAAKVRFGVYAEALLLRKVKTGGIRSAATHRRWRQTLDLRLLPVFGDRYLDQLRRADILEWQYDVAEQISRGRFAPTTANDWLKTLKVIVHTFVKEHELERDPVSGIDQFDLSMHRIYTREEPNALLTHEVPEFLAAIYRLYPQHFAMVALGFATGLRTCSLRPLRHKGPSPDVLLDEGLLLNRRSHTVKQEIMERTKIGLDQEIALPPDLVEILRWHIDRLPPGARQDSEFLFPGPCGGMLSSVTLWRVFNRVGKAIGLSKRFSPHGMRRTNKDLLRQSGVSQVVAMAISGHLTDRMHQHYSTVSDAEQRESIAKVISMADIKAAMTAPLGGVKGGRTRDRQTAKHSQRRAHTSDRQKIQEPAMGSDTCRSERPIRREPTPLGPPRAY